MSRVKSSASFDDSSMFDEIVQSALTDLKEKSTAFILRKQSLTKTRLIVTVVEENLSIAVEISL